MYIGKRLAATTALIGAIATAGVLTATPASADVGIRLSTSHNVGVYADYRVITNNDKVAKDLSPAMHDGIDADCYSRLGKDLGFGTVWYHTIAEYHNDLGFSQYVYGWTYAPYVDNSAAVGSLPDCRY
ncbi:hypothetical protein ABZ471_14315 [Streptomyces sp. NPDC005728]|uniref:hypothetical protein n=1 Tax=Streptomyces sp. NPDC005728 TaxID=3157054 RepID=UPI0033E9AD80